jgi:hypothetical protein
VAVEVEALRRVEACSQTDDLTMPSPDVTQEVWYWREGPVEGTPAFVSPDAEVCVELPPPPDGMDYAREEGMFLKGRANEYTKARVALAVRAPTFFRLLETLLKEVDLPADLEHLIRLNLHRAAPGVYEAPPVPKVDRKSAWAKLLADDLV